MDTARFTIDAGPLGGRITVNDEDVTDRVGIAELRLANGQPTTLSLHLSGTGTIEGEGVVQILEPRDDADIICGFLELVDPDELDNDGLNDADAGTNLTAAILKTLQ